MDLRIENAILKAIDDVNAMRTDTPLEISLDEKFIDEGGKLDSFGALTFIMALEPQLAAELGVSIDLLGAVSNSQNAESFKTFRGLASHIAAQQ